MTLAFDDITVVRGGRPILNGVTGIAKRGEVTVVIGKNGAGKSTLLRAAVGIMPPQRGQITVANSTPLAGMSPEARAAHIAFVPDESDVAFDFKVKDVVMLGRYPVHLGQPRAPDQEAVHAALAAVEGEGLADRRIKSLSRGERQRVMLARALAAETPVLVLDEPTANLDIAAALRLLALLKHLASQGKTILVSIHDLSLADRSADAAICLVDGKVLTAGSAAEVFSPSTLAAAFGISAERSGGFLRFDLPAPKRI